MHRPAIRRSPAQNRASLYLEITDRIIEELEAGRAPWVQPWGTAAAKAPLAVPKNAVTGRSYSGINVLILSGAVIEHGFPGQSWLTFRQALSLGGAVRKGERGVTVVYADRFTTDDEKKRARYGDILEPLRENRSPTAPEVAKEAADAHRQTHLTAGRRQRADREQAAAIPRGHPDENITGTYEPPSSGKTATWGRRTNGTSRLFYCRLELQLVARCFHNHGPGRRSGRRRRPLRGRPSTRQMILTGTFVPGPNTPSRRVSKVWPWIWAVATSSAS